MLGHSYSLGFTFSFPTRQISLPKAELACWTKGYVCEGVEGEDVGRLISEAIQRKGGMDIEVRQYVMFIINFKYNGILLKGRCHIE